MARATARATAHMNTGGTLATVGAKKTRNSPCLISKIIVFYSV